MASRRKGSVFQPRPGRGNSWAFTIDVQPPGAPRKQVKVGGFPTASAANDALTATRHDLLSGRHGQPSRLRFDDYLVQYLEVEKSQGKKQTTLAIERGYFTRYVFPRPIAAIRLSDLTARDFDLLYADLLRDGRVAGGPLSARTVRHTHALNSKALGDAVKKGMLRINPTTGASPPSAKAARPPTFDIWTPEQANEFLQDPQVIQNPLFTCIYLGIMTGMRRGELLGLWWESVDFERQSLVVERTRTNAGGEIIVDTPKSDASNRVIELDPGTCSVLQEHREAMEHRRRQLREAPLRGTDYVFARLTGEGLSPAGVTNRFRALVDQSGLLKIRFHDLRHSHASALIAAGVDVKIVQERLGHASPAFTLDRYVHTLPAGHAAAAETFGNLFTKGGSSNGTP